MHSRNTILCAILVALVGILAVGGLLSINKAGSTTPGIHPKSDAATPAATAATSAAATTPKATATSVQSVAPAVNAQSDTHPASGETPANRWPRHITDSRGTLTTLEQQPQRIVSLAPSVTQTLRAIGADNALVAIPEEGSDPAEADSLVRLSVYPTPSAEEILALRPNLLLGADITSPALAERLRQLGLKVIILGGGDYEGILADITRAGEATGTESTAAILVQALAALRDEVATEVAARNVPQLASPRLPPQTAASDAPALNAPSASTSAAGNAPSVLLFVGETPDYAAGAGSYAADLLQIAGADNLALQLNRPWPHLSREFILEANPQLLIFTVRGSAISSAPGIAGRSEALSAYLRDDPVWSKLDAVRQDRIYAIDQSLLNVPGPHVGEALSQLRAIIRTAEKR